MPAAPKRGWKLSNLLQLTETLVGQVFNDTYKIMAPVGKGGMGVVFSAENVRLKNARFAVKVLPAVWATNEINYARFKREAKILAGLHHPNIVQVMDFNKSSEGHPYLVMELLEGETLHQRLNRSSPLPREELRSLMNSLGLALQYAHDHGVIHRDLKPRNVFLARVPGAPPMVKLLDFGISKLLTASTMVTPSQFLVMGTPSYMSPEQAAGKFKEMDGRSDVFSLASIAYECLSGRRPFYLPAEGSPFDDEQIFYRIRHAQPEDLSALVPDLPPGVAEAISRAHAKEPEERHQRVDDFTRELTRALAAPPPPASLLRILFSRAEALVTDRRSSRLLIIAGGLGVGVVLSLLMLSLTSQDSTDVPVPAAAPLTAPAPWPGGVAKPEVSSLTVAAPPREQGTEAAEGKPPEQGAGADSGGRVGARHHPGSTRATVGAPAVRRKPKRRRADRSGRTPMKRLQPGKKEPARTTNGAGPMYDEL